MTGNPATPNLIGRRVLVAEDEWMIAIEMAEVLEAVGATVLGPVATIEKALAIAEAERPDAALVDLKLADGIAFPLADILLKRRVLVIFTTGYDAGSLPDRYAHVLLVQKPVSPDLVLEHLVEMLQPQSAADFRG